MLAFWKNPELVRHVRAELRPARMLGVAAIVLLFFALVALGDWNSVAQMKIGRVKAFGETFFSFVVSVQCVVLCLWSFFASLQSVARERELKTFDFQRTTSLSAGELLVGKLFGTPIVAWFIFLFCIPAAIVGTVAGGFTFGQVFLTYVLVLAFAVFLGLLGLCISMTMERPRTGAAVFGVLFFFWFAAVTGDELRFSTGTLLGFFGFSPFFAIYGLYRNSVGFALSLPSIFGKQADWFWVSLLLYTSFGAWLVVMLRRNLKREWNELRLLSRWQAIGFAFFINVLFYAFLQRPARAAFMGAYSSLDDRYEVILALNAVLLYWIGIIALAPPERLKVWARSGRSFVAGLFAEDGLVWPWVVLTSLLGMIGLAAYVFAGRLDEPEWTLNRALVILVTLLVFAVRDLLFLQWCMLTRMRRPVVKGVFFLLLYYISAGVVIVSSGSISEEASRHVASILTPFAGFDHAAEYPFAIAGVVLQLVLTTLLLNRISARLRRSSAIVAAQAA